MHSAVTTLPARRQIPVSVSLPLMVAAFCILWSSAFAVAKMAVAECPPLLLLTVRFLAAGLLVLGLARLSGGTWTLTRRDVFLFAVLGIANQALYLGLGYVGLRDISAGLSIVIASANPPFMRSVSGESSTTSTMSRATALDMMAADDG